MIVSELTEGIIMNLYFKKWIVLALLATTMFTVGWYVGTDSMYFKINKSLEVFGAVFREVSQNYVDDVDPETMIRSGMDGMLNNLDPYTVYMDQEEYGDFDSQINGVYVGFGIQAGTVDSMLTITGVTDGYSASRNGVRIGDRIVMIDSVNTLKLTSKELRKYTRGEKGSMAIVRFLRDGLKDTITLTLTREEITMKSVSYLGIVNNETGYIKLDRFSRRSAQEIRDAVDSLNRSGVKNFILDLRGNPGGLLDAAISICESFVPYQSIIVTTKGRYNAEGKVYTSSSYPYEGDKPLAILIDKSSASASEVVAGAIQDLDRGIVIGEQSFGKGLVQSSYPMPYNGSLKITTQKYYTPSGRCIQKVDYLKKRMGKNTDASMVKTFYTTNRRPVVDASGIIPDSTIKPHDVTPFVQQLTDRGLIFRFANEYAATYQNLPANFNANSLVDEVEKFAQKSKFSFESTAQKKLEELKKSLQDEKATKEVLKQVDDTEKILQAEHTKQFKIHSKQIVAELDREIRSRFQSTKAQFIAELKTDDVVNRTCEILRSESYRALLRTPTYTKH